MNQLKHKIIELLEPSELLEILDLDFLELVEYLEEAIEERLSVVEERIDELS